MTRREENRSFGVIKFRSTDVAADVEIIEISRRLDRHADELRLHILEEAKKEERFIRAQEANAASIDALTESIKPLVEAMTAAMVLRRFIVWLTGFSGVATFIAWYNDLFKISN